MELSVKQINKYKGKGVDDLIKIAEKHFNKYIRNRDANGECWFRCISCEQIKHISMMHAGHYMNAGQHGNVRFDEKNVHGQCSACNTHGHGNLIRYRENLVKKIGEEEVVFIENISRMTHKWDRYGLILIIETYKAKAKK